MDYESVYTIDLIEYGVAGEPITISAPTFGRKVRAKNARTMSAKVSRNGGETTVSELGAADQEIISILAFVESAPFQPTLQSFLAFMDRLDGVKKGNADRLYDELVLTVRKVMEGEDGPFADSQPAETASSE